MLFCGKLCVCQSDSGPYHSVVSSVSVSLTQDPILFCGKLCVCQSESGPYHSGVSSVSVSLTQDPTILW